MNEIEYAITNFEEFLEADIGQGDLHMCSAEIALAALREQVERSKGCVFCNDERHRIREVFDEGTAKIIDAENRYALSVDTSRDAAIFNIFYCPMCGKRLEVERDG